MVMGMIFSMHLFPPEAGGNPAVSAVILGNLMWLQLLPSGVSVEFWGLASADPKELNDVARKTVTCHDVDDLKKSMIMVSLRPMQVNEMRLGGLSVTQVP